MGTNSKDVFAQLDIRVGTICRAEAFPEARKPAYKLWVDLGELGIKQSSAQLTGLYSIDDLLGTQVICVCNLGIRQVGPFRSEVLVTGFQLNDSDVVLARPDRVISNGTRLS